MKTVMRELPCKLNDEEKRLRGRELAAEVKAKLDLEDEKKAAMADFKERKEDIDGKIVRLSRVVTSGLEARQVKCEERPNYSDRMVEFWRLDINERAGSRPMEPHELQGELKLLKTPTRDPKKKN